MAFRKKVRSQHGVTLPIVEIRALVLDMDGLMLDTESIYKRAWQRAAADCGYSFEDDFYFTLVGQPTPACEAAILERYAGFPLREFRARWPDLWRSDVQRHGIPTKHGLTQLLSYLDGKDIRVAVATSSDREYASLSLRAAGLEGRFDPIVTGDQVIHGKPAPDIFLESARRLEVSPRFCVALEDSDVGVLAASAAGMVTMMVPDLKEPSAEARCAAFSVLGSLLDAREQIELLMRQR